MNRRLEHIQNWPQLARQANWSVKMLAQECRVSTRTLEKHFRETFGVGPLAWLFEQRQKLALEFLKDGSSVKEVAAALSYHHSTHLSRDFKKQWGCSPSRLTKQPVVRVENGSNRQMHWDGHD